MAHVGLTPQSIRRLGGFKVQRDADQILDDARAVADAGAFAVVLECVPTRGRREGHGRQSRSPRSASALARAATARSSSRPTCSASSTASGPSSSADTPTSAKQPGKPSETTWPTSRPVDSRTRGRASDDYRY